MKKKKHISDLEAKIYIKKIIKNNMHALLANLQKDDIIEREKYFNIELKS